MTLSWKFYPQKATDPIHNPIAGEFFSTEAVGNVAEALVREGIQNTLDARSRSPDGTRQAAHVRIFVSEKEGAAPSTRAQRWFGSLWPHVTARGNGLRNQPKIDEVCPFLVYEDFGTIGLNGDSSAHLVSEGVTNHFLNFFRAEGHSDKGEQDRGSWGVGKTVFPRTSRISSFIGFTVRKEDGKHLLLGRSILKYHRIDNASYKSDGYLGVRRDDGLVLPTEDPQVLAEFRRDFRILRESECGLSIVVPWYDLDGEDGLSRDTVLAAVLGGFFYPILMGHLSVQVATPSAEVMLDQHTIVQEVRAIGGELARQMLPLIELAEWAQTRTSTEFISLNAPSPEGSQTWSAELLPMDVVTRVRETLRQRQRIALRVPMYVQLKKLPPQCSYFDVYLEHSEADSEKPVFIREELIISDVKSPRISQVRALVIVQNGPLANLLRDAETPAHTQWNQDTGNFKNKYKFGPGAIRFIRYSVSEMLRIINQAEQKPDPSITIDFFSIPATPEDEDAVPARRRKPKDSKGVVPPPPPLPPPVSRPRRFRIVTLDGGFAIRAGDPEAALPSYVDVQVAYDIRRGNPLRKYNKADFVLGDAPIRIENATGVEVREIAQNYMRVAVRSPGFNLEVRGFDTDRDLYIKAEAAEVSNGD